MVANRHNEQNNGQYNHGFRKETSALGISYPHLRCVFKQLLELPPGHFVNNCCLQRAIAMLPDGDGPLVRLLKSAGSAINSISRVS